MTEELLVVGKRLPRVDGADKATGLATYTVDMKLPRMLRGKVLRSPYPHARVLNIDTKQAEGLPGVKAVVTAQDVPNKLAFPPPLESPLASDKVCYVGEAVAGVAAIDDDVATEALDLIKVGYEELPAVFDVEEALQPGSPRIHQAERNIALHFEIARGDVEEGFREADFITEDRFVIPRVTHCCNEPNTCVASFDAHGRLTIWACAVRIFETRSLMARVMNLPEHRVRVVQSAAIGGHFGSRAPIPQSYYICALLAKKAGMAVKIENTREEEFAITRPAMPIIIELKMGVKRDGTITAKQTKLIGDGGAYYVPTQFAVLNVAAMRHESLYRFRNIKTEASLVFTNTTPPAAYRGFGNPQGHFALESMMDMLAEGIGMDPVGLRLKNATRTGDTTVHGWVIRSCGLSQCIEKSAESIDWRRKRASKQPKRGLGMGCAIHVVSVKYAGLSPTVDITPSGAIVKVNDDGTVNLLSGEGECGQGATTVLSQICAEELGVHLEDVQMSAADTDTVPLCGGPISSRVTTTSGNAVKLAAADAKRQLFQVAAKKLGANIEDLEAKDRKVYVRGHPAVAMSIAEVASAASYRPILGRGIYIAKQEGSDLKTLYGDCATAYSFAAQVAEVEVDTQTGEVKVLSLTAAHDLGRAINPLSAEGQIEGGVAQGIGMALTEELVQANGEVINAQFSDYKILTTLDMPMIKPILVESNEPRGPFGAKGVGEIVMVPTAAAIANAIYDAVGVRINEFPITAEKVLKALKRKSPATVSH